MTESTRLRALLLVIAAALCWSLLGVLGKWAQGAGVGPIEIGFWRAVIAGTLFLGQVGLKKSRLPRGRDLAAAGGLGLVAVATFYTSYQYAVALGGASLASVLLYTAPAMVAILGWAFWRHRLSGTEVVAVAVSVAGVASISLGGGAGVVVTPGSLTAGLIAGLCYALYYLIGRPLFQRYDPAAILAVMMAAGAIALAPLTRSHPSNLVGWTCMVVFGIVCTWLAYLLNGLGLRNLPATRASVVSSIEPVAAMAWAAVFLGERLTPLAILGALLVVGAAVTLGRAS